MMNGVKSVVTSLAIFGGLAKTGELAYKGGCIGVDALMKPAPNIVGHKIIPKIGPNVYASKYAMLPCDKLGNIDWSAAAKLLK